MENHFQVGDIILDIEGKQRTEPLYGLISKIRDRQSYYISWFADETKEKYATYMYFQEIKKVS